MPIIYKIDYPNADRPIRQEVEKAGYPHPDADGETQCVNTHFCDEGEAWDQLLRAQALRETDPATQGQILGLVAFCEDQLRETAKRKVNANFGKQQPDAKRPEIDLSPLVPISVALLKVGGTVAGLWLVGCAVVEGAKAVAAFIVANATWFGLGIAALLALIVASSGRRKPEPEQYAAPSSSGPATFNFNIHVGNDGKLMQQ